MTVVQEGQNTRHVVECGVRLEESFLSLPCPREMRLRHSREKGFGGCGCEQQGGRGLRGSKKQAEPSSPREDGGLELRPFWMAFVWGRSIPLISNPSRSEDPTDGGSFLSCTSVTGRRPSFSVPLLQEGARAFNMSESESATDRITSAASCRVPSYDSLGDGVMRCWRYSTDVRASGDAMTQGLLASGVATVLPLVG